jgi:hypothetical protein
MAGSSLDYLGRARLGNQVTNTKLQALVDCPVISKSIVLTGAAGTQQAVEIPAGAYVYKVGLLCTGTVAGNGSHPASNVGDGVVTTRYMSGITDMRQYDIFMAPVPNNAVGGAVVGGHYYATADTIDITNDATCTTGTVKLMVWYYLP